MLSLQRRHMNVVVSQITVSSTVCSTCPGLQQRNSQTLSLDTYSFVINHSWPYEITHTKAWVRRSRNRNLQHCHYSDDTRASLRSTLPSAWQFAQQHVMTDSKIYIQTPWFGTKLVVILKSRFEALLLRWPNTRVMKCQIPVTWLSVQRHILANCKGNINTFSMETSFIGQ